MDNFNFDAVIPRTGTNSVKWDIRPDVLPMWVADMDFQTAPCIIGALHKMVDHGIFGYTHPLDSYYDAIIHWFSSRRGWNIQRDWIIPISGLVPGLSVCIKALTEPGDEVIMLSPGYNCFFSSIRNVGAVLSENKLLRRGTSFVIDFEDLERRCASDRAKVLLVCNPHNPCGRVWTAEELRLLGETALRHGLYIISDEIHCELEMPGHKYTPLASVDPRFEEITITLTSPTKSFNIAGIHISNMVSANPEIRARVDKVINIWEHCDVNQFGVTALTAAYSVRGAEWLRALNAYLWDNYLALKDLLVRELPDYTVMDLEGTYLVWVDCGACKVPTTTVQEELIKTEKVWVNSGEIYGDKRYMRINIACPRGLLMEGLGRFVKGIKRLSK